MAAIKKNPEAVESVEPETAEDKEIEITKEQAALVVLQNFPSIEVVSKERMLKLAEVSIDETVFARVEKARGMILSGLDDKKGYAVLVAHHKFVKSVKTTIKKAVAEIAMPHFNEHRTWLAIGNALNAWVDEVEAPLGQERKRYEDEQERIKKEEQIRLNNRTNARMEILRQIEAPFALVECQTLSEEQWADFEAPLREAFEKKQIGKKRVELLAECETTISVEDAADMTDEAFDSFLAERREAWQTKKDEDAAEAIRLANEEAERVAKGQRYLRRFEFLNKKKTTPAEHGISLEQLREMSDDAFLVIVTKITDAEAAAEKARVEAEKAKAEADRLAAVEKAKDSAFQIRYMALVNFGVQFDTAYAAEVREMSDEEYQTTEAGAKIAFDAREAEAAKDRAELARRREAEKPKPVLVVGGALGNPGFGSAMRNQGNVVVNEARTIAVDMAEQMAEMAPRGEVAEITIIDEQVQADDVTEFVVPEGSPIDVLPDEDASIPSGHIVVVKPEQTFTEADAEPCEISKPKDQSHVLAWATDLKQRVENAPKVNGDNAAEYSSYLAMILDTIQDVMALFEGEQP